MVKPGEVIEYNGPGVIWIEPPTTMAKVLESLAKFDCESVSVFKDGNKLKVSAVIKTDVEDAE